MKSAWRPRPAIYGRTNSVGSLQCHFCFSLSLLLETHLQNRRLPHPFASFAKGWETTRSYRFCGLIDDIVYDSVFLSLLGIHDEVPLYVLFYLIQLLTAMFRK